MLPVEYSSGEVASWLDAVSPHFANAAVEVLGRPTELVVMHLRSDAHAPDLGALAAGPSQGRLVHTVVDERYSLELVLPWRA